MCCCSCFILQITSKKGSMKPQGGGGYHADRVMCFSPMEVIEAKKNANCIPHASSLHRCVK